MPANRARSRSKRRKRKMDAEVSFVDILGEVFSEDEKEIVDDLAKDEDEEHVDVSKNSIPGQDEFMKKQKEIDEND